MIAMNRALDESEERGTGDPVPRPHPGWTLAAVLMGAVGLASTGAFWLLTAILSLAALLYVVAPVVLGLWLLPPAVVLMTLEWWGIRTEGAVLATICLSWIALTAVAVRAWRMARRSRRRRGRKPCTALAF